MRGDMDFNAGTMLDGRQTLDEAGMSLLIWSEKLPPALSPGLRRSATASISSCTSTRTRLRLPLVAMRRNESIISIEFRISEQGPYSMRMIE